MSNQHSKCDDCYKTHLPEAHDGIIVLPSEAFGEGYVPEFNQSSEDELHELLIEKLNTKKRMIEPHDERFIIGFKTKVPGDDVDWQYLDEVIMRFVKYVIRTEKLRLLDEVIHQSTVNLKSAKAVAGWAELRKEEERLL